MLVWDTSANVSTELPGGRAGAWIGAEPTRSPVAWIHNGSALVGSGGPNAPLRVWDRLKPPRTFTSVVSPGGQNFSSISMAPGGRTDGERTSIAASPDGKLLASTSLGGAVDLWQLSEPGGYNSSGDILPMTHLQRLQLKSLGIHASFSSDGKTLAVVQHGRPPERLQLYHLNRPWLQTNNGNGDESRKHGQVLAGPAHTRVTPSGQSGPPAADAGAGAGASSGVDACHDSCGSFDIVESGWARRLWDSNSPYEESLSGDARLHLSHLGWNAHSWAKCANCRKNHWARNATACVADLYLPGRAALRCPASQLASWEDLGELERLSAQSLGFTAATWTATSPFSCCSQERPHIRDRHGDADDPPYSPSGHHPSKTQEPLMRTKTDDSNNTMFSPSGSTNKTQQQQQKPHSIFESLGALQLESDSQELVFSSAYSPDGKRIAAGTGHGSLVWDLSGASGPLPVKLPGARTNGVHWSPDSRLLAAPQSNGYVGIWDFGLEQSGKAPVVQLKPRLDGVATGVAFSPQQDLLVSATSGGELQVRRSPASSFAYCHPDDGLKAPETPDSVQLPRQETFFLEGVDINDLVFSPDGATLAAAAQTYSAGLGGSGALLIWSVDAYGVLQKILEVQTRQRLSGVSFSPDGTKIAATHGSFDPPEERGVVLWEAASLLDIWDSGDSSTVITANDTRHQSLLPTAGLPSRAAFSPDGRILACATEEAPTSSRNFLLWDAETGMELVVEGLPLRPFGPRPLTMDWLPKVGSTGGAQTYTLAVAGRDFSLTLMQMEYKKGTVAKVERIQKLQAHGDTDVYSGILPRESLATRCP